ncbi:MAG TPA: hypothetical protein VJQ50_04375 [Terriglobales bacterium]|nr:hypothetical protein [Terriglobales bacterium]
MPLRAAYSLLLCMFALSALTWAQRTTPSPRPNVSTNAPGQTAPWAPTSADLKFHKMPPKPGGSDMERQLQQANTEKEQLKQDTAKLLKLIAEIKDDLDDSPAGTVGSDDLKRSEEIEKLAKKLHKAFQSETK